MLSFFVCRIVVLKHSFMKGVDCDFRLLRNGARSDELIMSKMHGELKKMKFIEEKMVKTRKTN